MSSILFVYVTVPSEDEARRIAHAVVTDRLAACANIYPAVRSVYHWQGKLEEAQEVSLILKTRASLYPALETRVKELHSYQTPCITAMPVTHIQADYMQWILDETKP